jgi:phosphonopyruvate decarboxylase
LITSDAFLRAAMDRGFDFYTGVPCSFLTPLINGTISSRELNYVGAASEGEAVAIASGAWLAGRQTVVMCQNSGLGNAVNPLTSLNAPFHIPTLLVVTWRGQPGLKDEPQHEVMGEITASLLDVIRVPHVEFPTEEKDIAPVLDRALEVCRKENRSFALIMKKGSVRDDGLNVTPEMPRSPGRRQTYGTEGALPTRSAVLEYLLALAPKEAGIIATTGMAGRELYALADRPQHLYQVGSMGCASGMGLGVALNTKHPVIVVDGDGAALMKMGTLATIGHYAPENLIHVLLDNGVHDSTGGQPTVSGTVDFASIAAACHYRFAAICRGLDGFDKGFKAALHTRGPSLLHIRIAPGSALVGRPKTPPYEIARRFQTFLAS